MVGGGQLALHELGDLGLHARHQHALPGVAQGRGDVDDLLRGLARGIHHLGKAVAQGPVGVDARVGRVDEGQARQGLQRGLGLDLPPAHGVQELAQLLAVHGPLRGDPGRRSGATGEAQG